MAELNIQIPDELAERLEPIRNRLPELLSQLLAAPTPSSLVMVQPLQDGTAASDLPATPQVYLEVLDFLVTRPSAQDIVCFKVSAATQERLQFLLDKNRQGSLTDSELAELNVYEQLEHLMILMKARALAAGE